MVLRRSGRPRAHGWGPTCGEVGGAAQRRDARQRPGIPGQHHAVARRADRPPPEVSKLATNAALWRDVQDRLAGAIAAPGGATVPGPHALEEAGTGHGSTGAGSGVEPAVDRPSPAARLSRERDHAGQPQGQRPSTLHTRPEGAAPRAGGLPGRTLRVPQARMDAEKAAVASRTRFWLPPSPTSTPSVSTSTAPPSAWSAAPTRSAVPSCSAPDLPTEPAMTRQLRGRSRLREISGQLFSKRSQCRHDSRTSRSLSVDGC